MRATSAGSAVTTRSCCRSAAPPPATCARSSAAAWSRPAIADLAAYERLMFEVLLKLPHVADVRSNFALRTVKAPGPLPL
jgi:hypothetical protein